MNDEPRNVKLIFAEALEKPTAVERVAYLDKACSEDANLRAEVEELLKSHEQAGDFMEAPALEMEVTMGDPALTEGPGTVIGRYKLLERIGEGGMAVVYMAEQKRPIRRRVAVKLIKLGMDTRQVIARFEAERQVLAMMDHPNIAKVLDAGTTESGRPYFVMELVRGVSITDFCDQNKLSTRQRLELFISVCQAVHHAHQKGIIHRDIKPSNVMVTLHDGQPVAKVIDFGIAKAVNQELTEKTVFTRYAQMIGTPEYMSPEQAEMSGLGIDVRTDVFSLGVLLYELLTGTTPFDAEYLRGKGYAEIQRIIREEEPLRPSTKISTLGEAIVNIAKSRQTSPEMLAKRIRAELDWITMKTLEKDRNRRYESVSELAADVKHHLKQEPVLAGPPSTIYVAKKFVQRHYVGLSSGAVVTTAILLGLVVGSVFYMRAEQADHDRRISMAQQLYAEGRYQAALVEMKNEGLNKSPDVKVRLLYAQILLGLDRREEADAHLQGLTDAEPETAGAAHYLLARLHLGNNLKKSEEHRLLAEEILPWTADGYALRALTAATPDEALKWLKEGLRLDPGHYASRKARALVHYGLRDYAGVLRDAEAMIAMRSEDSTGYTLRALAEREIGQLDEALFDHNRAIGLCKIEGELPVLYEQRQETFWRLGDYQAALQDAQRCVALAPETLAYRVPLAKILFKLGNYEAAKQEFTRIRAGQGALWQAVSAMVQYTLDVARAGETLDIPDSLSEVWPFLHLEKYIDLNTQLEQKGMRLVQRACDLSSWSPDGTQLAYGRSELCTWDDNSLRTRGTDNPAIARGIQILDLASGRTRTLVTWGGAPAWSPDGRFIAFVQSSDMAAENEAEVWLIPAGGGQPRRLTQGAYPSWTNDSTHLYFHSRSQNALCYIDIMEAAAEPIQVAKCPGLYPAVSPDEKYLAYATGGELTVVDLHSGKELLKWVVPGPEKYCCVQWSPDGKEISMSVLGMRNYCSGLWMFDFERKQGWHLLDSEAIRCNWSRDKSVVAFDIFFPVGEIWIAHVDPNLPTWKTLAPMQTRGQYIRSHWPKYVVSYGRAWSMEKKDVLNNLTAVGVNQYEYREYEDALWTLQRVVELREDKSVGPDVKANAYVVMALQQIGRREEATEALHRLRRTYEQAADLYDRKYLHDVEQLLVNVNSEPD